MQFKFKLIQINDFRFHFFDFSTSKHAKYTFMTTYLESTSNFKYRLGYLNIFGDPHGGRPGVPTVALTDPTPCRDIQVTQLIPQITHQGFTV